MVKISPSILSADFSELGEEVINVDEAGTDFIHIDIMDENFVSNISIGLPIIKSIRNKTSEIFDVHLVIENPSRYIDDLVNADTDIITIHHEAEEYIDRAIEYIKSKGIRAGVSLNPGTPTFISENIINKLDLVLIISVNPGFGGQESIPYALDKIKEVKEMSPDSNKNLLIEVGGGVGKTSARAVIGAGANVLIADSAVFGDGNLKGSTEAVRRK